MRIHAIFIHLLWGVVFASANLIASMKSYIVWADHHKDFLAPWLLTCSSLPARQELKWGAKDGKLGVMTTQFPDHSNLSRMILTIATSDGNNKTAG